MMDDVGDPVRAAQSLHVPHEPTLDLVDDVKPQDPVQPPFSLVPQLPVEVLQLAHVHPRLQGVLGRLVQQGLIRRVLGQGHDGGDGRLQDVLHLLVLGLGHVQPALAPVQQYGNYLSL